ncbi:YrzI family small protein [Niallia circulans]|uniref:YrzI family small protein n=2 Tax=Niallia circulans TaxID=1397 RepID=A0A553SKF7_NIACI|nr:YrzI family small protein [Niallia circulans]
MMKGGDIMTLNILFMTITIKRKQQTYEQFMHDQLTEQIIEESKHKQVSLGDFTRNTF